MKVDSDSVQVRAWANPSRVVEIATEALQEHELGNPKDPTYSLRKELREGVIYSIIITLPDKAEKIAVELPEFAEYVVGRYPELAAKIARRLPEKAAALAKSAHHSLRLKQFCDKSAAAHEGSGVSGEQILFDVVQVVPDSAPKIVDEFNSLATSITKLAPRQARKIVEMTPRVAAEVAAAVPDQALDLAKSFPRLAVAIAEKVPGSAERIRHHYRV